EAVLRLVPLRSTEEMRDQLDRLISLSRLPNVRFGVIPFGVHLPVTPQAGFQIYGETGAIEDFIGDRYLYGDDLAKLERIHAMLWDEAVEGDGARRLVVAAQSAL